MRILYMGNNRVGLNCLTWLKERGADIVGLVMHSPDRAKFGDEIRQAAAMPDEHVFQGPQLRDPESVEVIKSLKPDIGLSVLFGYILTREFLDIFPRGAINVHPSLLPFNRGANPNVWSIVDKTPCGVTIHYIDPGIDTGAIIAQKELTVQPIDTGRSLYRKMEEQSLVLFQETWPKIERGHHTRTKQQGKGSYHPRSDVRKIDKIDLDAEYRAGHLIDIIRALTFPPYRGAYFEHDGRKVYLELKLSYGEDADQGTT